MTSPSSRNRLRPAAMAAALALGALALGLLVAGCGKKVHNDPPASELYDPGPPSNHTSPPPQTESQRTREMEAKQAEMNRIAEEARSGQMTPEQVEQAYKDYERQRLEMNQISERNAPPPADAPVADYPPPPL